MGLAIFDEKYPISGSMHFIAGSGVAETWMWDETPVPSRVDAMFATNTDVIDHVVDVWFSSTSFVLLLGSVNVPAGAGVAGAPTIDLVAHLPLSTQGGLVFGRLDSLKMAMEVAVTAAFSIDIVVLGGRL